ncbi:hypothetical protein L6164_015757 [Bauhinia variegata]|uniref:Uncharacterized protein n=1 Tax=Bauhinia variegata TaxID=167791 RepID=A0ACB9NMT5_BAUVA|nr:hypothetical protein L6164_015757 [Bauhinia variegata]
MAAILGDEELHLFHMRDREVIRRLLVSRSPAEALLIMALWLWFENIGYPSVIASMATLANPQLINVMAREAMSCLRVLEAENPIIPPNGGLPITSTLMQREISLQLLNLTRFTAVSGVKSVLEKVCVPIFSDIIENYLYPRNRLSLAAGTDTNPFGRFVVPGFPHPLFDNFTIPANYLPSIDLFDVNVWNDQRPCSNYLTKDDKTMFLTFSRGFPVSEQEVRMLFQSCFGDIIVELTMGNHVNVNDKGYEQILFATMVVNSIRSMDKILKGKRIAKFRVNGKHIWARKYARRLPN